MKKFFPCLLLLGLLPSTLFSQPTLSLPPAAQGDVGDWITVQAVTNCPDVKWYVIDPGLKLFPPTLLKSTLTAVVTGKTNGTYRLMGITGNKDGITDPQFCAVTVGTPTPPPPPVPTDPLAAAIQQAYTADGNANKAALKTNLQSIYYFMKAFTLKDTAMKTVADVYAKRDSIPSGIGPTDLVSEQQVINSWLVSKFPASQVLDNVTRTGLVDEFDHVATALGQVNGTTKSRRN